MYYKDFIRKLYEIKINDLKNATLDELLNEYIDDIVYMLSKHVENKYINENGDIIVKEVNFDKGIVSFRLVNGISADKVVNDENFIEFLNQLIAEATNSTLMLDKMYPVSKNIVILKFKKFGDETNNA